MIRERCPICQSPEVAEFWPHVWSAPDRKVLHCDACRVLFLWPIPTESELDAYHARYAEHLAARGVTSSRETPEETYRRREPLQQYRVDIVAQKLRPDSKVLEVGGGCGNFIGRLLHEGIVTDGALIETCAEHRNFAASRHPGLSCLPTLGDAPRESFDAVLAMHVLEHIAYPAGFLERCAALLKPGGLLILETPNASDPLVGLYSCTEFKDYYFQPMHPYVFHRRTLEYLAGKVGLVPTGFRAVQRYSFSNHLQWLAQSKPGGNEIFQAMFLETDSVYRRELEQAGITDTLFGFMRKPL